MERETCDCCPASAWKHVGRAVRHGTKHVACGGARNFECLHGAGPRHARKNNRIPFRGTSNISV
eukprot:2613455-Alexandrium_andersonii.AAC.1